MKNNRVLIVDDEPVIRRFLVRVLEGEGYEVQAASNGHEALDYLDSTAFDLLLTDIKMDQLDGVELLRQARARHPDLSVILLTGHATVSSAVAALRHGAFEYLLKPVKNEDLATAVATGLQERARQQRRDRLERMATQMLDVMQSPEPGDTQNSTPVKRIVACNGLRLDVAAYTASLDDYPLNLTPTEFRLLLELSRFPGVTFDYIKLVQAACGYSCARHEAREIIGTHVLNLRQKLGIIPGQALYIESIRGVGYRLIPPDRIEL
jgi:DNA-binding response OmpR family regulator